MASSHVRAICYGSESENMEEAEIPLAHQASQESTKVDDSSCPLDIYLPKMKSVVRDGLQTFEIGEDGTQHIKTKTVMVVGATGVGKTTFLNSMANYVFGVEEKDPFR